MPVKDPSPVPQNGPVNLGTRATLPGRPSAAMVKQQLQVVDRMILKQELELHRKILEEQSMPEADRTPIFKAQKAQVDREIARLTQAKVYWLRIYHEELARLKAAGAPQDLLPRYVRPPIFIPEKIYPKEVGLDPFQFEPLPGIVDPGEVSCDLPGASARAKNLWLMDAWDDYREKRDHARECYESVQETWNVQKELWRRRRDRAFREKKPFHEAEPDPPPNECHLPPMPVCP